jgi:hypothetical protein
MKKETKLEELEKRIRELELRPIYYPVYQPTQPPLQPVNPWPYYPQVIC